MMTMIVTIIILVVIIIIISIDIPGHWVVKAPKEDG